MTVTSVTTSASAGRVQLLIARVARLPLAVPCVAAVLLAAGLDLAGDPTRLSTAFGDSDDATRLVMVRDFIAGAPWFDTTLPRIGAPEALVSHWSRLIDLGLATLLACLRLVLAPAGAETAMRFIWPLLLLVPMLLLIADEARQRAGILAAWLAIGLTMTSVTGTVEFTPGRIDHHSAMILGCLAGIVLLGRGFVQPGAARLAGVAFGLGTAIGYEALALTVASFVLAGLYSFVIGRGGAAVSRAAIAFAATLGLALVATTAPSHWLHSTCDALSLNLVLLAGLGAAALTVALRTGPQPADRTLIQRLALPAVLGMAGLVAYGVAEPACLRGPFGQQDPAIGPIWLAGVNETRSLLWLIQSAPFMAGVLVATTVLALAAAWWQAQDERDDRARLAFGIFAVAAVLACWQVKLMAYASLLAVLPLACMVARLQGIQGISAPMTRTLGFIMSSQYVLGLLSGPLLAGLIPANDQLSKRLALVHRCIGIANVQPLAALPSGLVFADRDLGPFIAALTDNRVVAAPYHRLDKAIIATDRILFEPAGDAVRELRGLGVDTVVLCPGLTRALDKPVRPDSLVMRLNSGGSLAGLEPLALSGETTLKAWRVMR